MGHLPYQLVQDHPCLQNWSEIYCPKVVAPQMVAHLPAFLQISFWFIGQVRMVGRIYRMSDTVDSSEIWRSPVEVGSWNPIIYDGFWIHPNGGCLGISEASTVGDIQKKCTFWVIQVTVVIGLSDGIRARINKNLPSTVSFKQEPTNGHGSWWSLKAAFKTHQKETRYRSDQGVTGWVRGWNVGQWNIGIVVFAIIRTMS